MCRWSPSPTLPSTPPRSSPPWLWSSSPFCGTFSLFSLLRSYCLQTDRLPSFWYTNCYRFWKSKKVYRWLAQIFSFDGANDPSEGKIPLSCSGYLLTNDGTPQPWSGAAAAGTAVCSACRYTGQRTTKLRDIFTISTEVPYTMPSSLLKAPPRAFTDSNSNMGIYDSIWYWVVSPV